MLESVVLCLPCAARWNLYSEHREPGTRVRVREDGYPRSGWGFACGGGDASPSNRTNRGHPIFLLSRKYFIKNHLHNINRLQTMSFS